MTVDLHVLCEQFREQRPPQQRDRLIFEAVAIKQRSQTEVAREHGISQPRVAQIVVEVGRWVARVVPQAHDQLSQEERLGLASFLVESQLRYWQDLVTAAWTTSGENKVVLKETPRKDGSIVREETTIPQGRKIGFLNAGMRLALALARLSGVDTSGRTQRMAAMAEAAARRANVNVGRHSQAEVGRPFRAVADVDATTTDGVPSYEAEKELIGQTGSSVATEPADSSQDECLSLDTRFHWTLEEEREASVKRLMKVLREDEELVTASDEVLRSTCESLWENEFRAEAEEFHRMKHIWFPHLVDSAAPSEHPAVSTVAAPPLSEPQAMSETKPLAIHEPLDQHTAPDSPTENIPSRLPRGERRRLRREWERRRSQANQRQFLAPLATG